MEAESETTYKTCPDKEGYWWWLPMCFIGQGDNKMYWSIIRYDKTDFDKEGIFVGPLEAPIGKVTPTSEEKVN